MPEQGRDLGKHHLRDEGQVKLPGPGKRQPVQVTEFVRGAREIVEVPLDQVRISKKEARVETPRSGPEA